jgi:hypothetical protein
LTIFLLLIPIMGAQKNIGQRFNFMSSLQIIFERTTAPNEVGVDCRMIDNTFPYFCLQLNSHVSSFSAMYLSRVPSSVKVD